MAKSKTDSASKTETKKVENNAGFAFGKENYKWMLIGLAVIALGYILMIGGGSEDPNVFTGDELFNFQRLTLSPILILAGFVIEIFAIMKKSKD